MSDSKITNLQIVILNIGEFAFVEIHEYSENVDIISMSDEFKGIFTISIYFLFAIILTCSFSARS